MVNKSRLRQFVIVLLISQVVALIGWGIFNEKFFVLMAVVSVVITAMVSKKPAKS